MTARITPSQYLLMHRLRRQMKPPIPRPMGDDFHHTVIQACLRKGWITIRSDAKHFFTPEHRRPMLLTDEGLKVLEVEEARMIKP